MSEAQPVKKRRSVTLPSLKRIVTLLVIVLVAGVVVAGVGAAAVWGHFWNFNIGNPPSETCSNCHAMESYVESLKTTAVLGGSHANRSVTCTDCHDYDFDHQINDTVAYLTGNFQNPLPQERYGMDFCFRCHEHGSYDQIAGRTMDLGVTDAQSKGESANPHQSPHYSNLECNLCHRVHTPSTLYCWECHTFDFGNPQFVRDANLTPEVGVVPEAFDITETPTPPAN